MYECIAKVANTNLELSDNKCTTQGKMSDKVCIYKVSQLMKSLS